MSIDIATLNSVFEDHARQEEELRFRNPSVSFWYNWVVVAVVMVLFYSFVWWGKSIAAERHDEAVRQSVYAEMDAEHEAMIAAAEEEQLRQQQAEADLQIREAKAIARMWFGVRNFTEKYHYTNDDLFTYAMCAVVRSEATGKSIEDVLAEEGQFIAYSPNNNLETEYYNLALQFVADLHAGNLKTCDSKYKYAALTDMGIWLVDDPGKKVPERWHA